MSISHLVIIGGLSGSGKSTALNALEDIGFYCVDNLPAPLIGSFVKYLEEVNLDGQEGVSADLDLLPSDEIGAQGRVALLVGANVVRSVDEIENGLERLKAASIEVTVLFIDAQDEVVIRRFQETRRPHPLLKNQAGKLPIREALERERAALSRFRELADRVIDTSGCSPHDLRRLMFAQFTSEHSEVEGMSITLTSFGFKYGAPVNADLIVDVRFLANPHFVPELREFTGNEAQVRDYVFQDGDAEKFLEQYLALLEFLIPRYEKEGKHYLNIAIGCTGGKHRSVALVNEIESRLLASKHNAIVFHRDSSRVV